MSKIMILLATVLLVSPSFAEDIPDPALEDSIKLSNYDWNYAPYVSHLREHVDIGISQRKGFKFGLVDGRMWVSFKLLRDGKSIGLKLLGPEGSPLKKNRWTKEMSLYTKVKPLPEDFPDEYLEVTGIFNFSVIRLKEEKEKPPALEKENVIINDEVGEVIDLEERNRFGLFREVDGFLSASYFKHPGDTYTIQLVTLDPSGEEVAQDNPVSHAAVEMIRATIKEKSE